MPKNADAPIAKKSKNIFNFLKQYSQDIAKIYYQSSVPEPKTIKYGTNEVVQALKSIKHNQITLILGKAGTGKSTFVKKISVTPGLVLLAPTGIAAHNIHGATIHSFFALMLDVQNPSYVNTSDEMKDKCAKVKYLVIDEISMVRADILDAVDRTLKTNRNSDLPFGGVKTILIGDLHQLPPVLTSDDTAKFESLNYCSPYFFDSKVIREAIESSLLHLIQFTITFRQQQGDPFLNVLDKISECILDEKTDHFLKTRILRRKFGYQDSITILSPFREAVKRYNTELLEQINEPSYFYHASISGSYYRYLKKDPKKRNYEDLPNLITLEFRVGARVIFIKNEQNGNWVNGTIGTITELFSDKVKVNIHGRVETVTSVTWSEYRYVVKHGILEKIEIGKFEQLPIRLGWALTIHKSQGLTLENVYLDLGRKAFAYGQTYVALSRVRKAENIFLKRAIQRDDLIDEYGIEEFLSELENYSIR